MFNTKILKKYTPQLQVSRFNLRLQCLFEYSINDHFLPQYTMGNVCIFHLYINSLNLSLRVTLKEGGVAFIRNFYIRKIIQLAYKKL